MNFRKIFDSSKFGKETGVQRVALSALGLAVWDGNKNYFAFNGDQLVDVTENIITAKKAFYKVPTQVVKPGDVIVGSDGLPVIVTAVDPMVVINPATKNVEEKIGVTNILNLNFYAKYVNLYDSILGDAKDPMSLAMQAMLLGDKDADLSGFMLPALIGGGTAGAAGTLDQNALLPLMMLGGDDKDDMFMMLLMAQGGVEKNPMLPLLLMSEGKSGNNKDAFKTIMMLQAFSGQAFSGQAAPAGTAGGMNPLMLMALAGDDEIDPMMIFAMGGLGAAPAAGAANPMAALLPIMMMSKNKDIDPLMFLMMSGANPFAPKAPAAPAPAAE